MRTCKTCDEDKTDCEFYNRASGTNYTCKCCTKAKQNVRFAEMYAKVNEIKLGKGCNRCGYHAHACALDFHHINPESKYKPVAYLVRHATWGKVLAEIDKCEIVCSNCHRVEHHGS